MTSVDKVCTQLRDHGRRVTPQRRAIIRTLLANNAHPTADKILTRVRREMPTISPATVYNTLHELAEMGLLLELDLGLGLEKRRYDLCTEDHDHLICLECGQVEDVPHHISELTLSSEHDHGFQVVDCRVIYLGYCPECASKGQ